MSKVLKQSNQRAVDDVRVIPIGEVISRPTPQVLEAPPTEETETDVVQRLAEARAEAERLLAEAEEQAAQLLAKAEASSHQIQEEARQLGYQNGFAAGRLDGEAAGQAAYAEQLAHVERVLQEARQAERGWLEQLPAALTELVMAAVSHVLLRELTLAPANIEAHVTQLLQQVAETTSVEVRVHPDDFEQAKACHASWQSARFGTWELSVVPDLSVERGGAEVRSDTGRVDGCIQTQLSEVRSVVCDVLERGLPHELGTQVS